MNQKFQFSHFSVHVTLIHTDFRISSNICVCIVTVSIKFSHNSLTNHKQQSSKIIAKRQQQKKKEMLIDAVIEEIRDKMVFYAHKTVIAIQFYAELSNCIRF